jgi:hypothetical protein
MDQTSLVGQFGFVEWSEDSHLRHSRFVALASGQDGARCAKGRVTTTTTTFVPVSHSRFRRPAPQTG